MSINKTIHYCWFGNSEKSELIKKCVNSWSKLKGYEIIEWNEENFNINSHPYIKKAYENKKYAFVSDYVRLKVLYEYGGIYLDTDIEVKKSFDNFLNNDLFLGFMYDSLLGTAVIGAKKNNKIIKELLDRYDKLELNNEANNNMYTQYFLNNFPNFKLNNKYQNLGQGISIYPKEYFERPTYKKSIHYSEHHYSASWKDEKKGIIKKIAKKVIPNVIYRNITHKMALKQTPYYNIYLRDKKNS